MKPYFKVVGLLFVILFIFSCASKPPVPPDTWPYEKDAVHFRINADAQLNFQDGMPHTLLLCVYQLRDPNVFNQLSENEQGLYKLMECGIFNASVVSSKRLIIHPGTVSTFILDRAENAKFIAVVSGYYTLHKENIIRLFEVPVVREREGLKITKVSKPGMLNVELTLGPKQIVNVKEISKNE